MYSVVYHHSLTEILRDKITLVLTSIYLRLSDIFLQDRLLQMSNVRRGFTFLRWLYLIPFCMQYLFKSLRSILITKCGKNAIQSVLHNIRIVKMAIQTQKKIIHRKLIQKLKG